MSILNFLPKSKPQAKRNQVETYLQHIDRDVYQCCLVGIRGYYLNTMGKPGVNDRKIYDDAIFLLGPETFAAFNANCDPGAFQKHMANLKAGTWFYKLGIHGLSKPKDRQYRALVQAADVTVVRDLEGEQTGRFGINIHRGGTTKVSSIGCQTIVPAQWPAFIALVEAELKKVNQKVIPYILVEGL